MSRRTEKALATRRRLDAAMVDVRAWFAGHGIDLAQVAPRPLSLETTGDPRSANSAAPKGCVGQGMGGTPMSPDVQPVPAENAPTASTTAQGIVTRMGQDLQGLGGAAIEPGPEGMRPASSGFGACAGASGACAAATPAGPACAARAGAAALHTPPSNTGVNKIGSGHGV